ncbi:MAG: helix-turn-helix domain-containing protein [Giesbergeria sp.]|uniref:helix-turn-helix domain-containing protein n=1 Tax=Giesbergeria sp. TaxID=2818473 RepID=UPI002621D697|nr:helix-turn-helix domain-containing protein [Giesbergeria sp.]MDD2609721.1 helix-turn-helix domain-containing protein [Giesbergeria sp.]
MQIGNRFRCYPTPAQEKVLLQWIGCQRFIYNAKVQEDRYFRTFARKSLDHTGQFAPIDQQYSQFKHPELTPWLSEVPSQLLRNGAAKWMQAYSRFFAGLGGRPTIQAKYGK